MNVSTPDLLTLLQWSERRAAGEPCAPWDVWRASSTDAAWKSKQIEQAQELLRGGRPPDDVDSELSEEELAQFVDGRLASAEADRVEQGCWRSPAQLAEVVSALRFMSQPPYDDLSQSLQARLIAIVPAPTPERTNGKGSKFRLASAMAVEPPPVSPSNVTSRAEAYAAHRFWPLVAAIFVAAI